MPESLIELPNRDAHRPPSLYQLEENFSGISRLSVTRHSYGHIGEKTRQLHNAQLARGTAVVRFVLITCRTSSTDHSGNMKRILYGEVRKRPEERSRIKRGTLIKLCSLSRDMCELEF